MKTIGIITIHKINNYGSVLQAYALQSVCEEMGYETEIIDYRFPNSFHTHNHYALQNDSSPKEPRFMKLLYSIPLLRQHNSIGSFVDNYLKLSDVEYNHPNELLENPPKYDIYITGSDQLWNPRHTKADPAFFLHFAPEEALKISYAASSCPVFPDELRDEIGKYLKRYAGISVREFSGKSSIETLTDKNVHVVLDPTLLLRPEDWNRIAFSGRLVKKKYILCYFLNYSFNAFPYVDELADNIRQQTGYSVIYLGRPPHSLFAKHYEYRVGSSIEEFLAYIRDAEIVLTTSFHGTAFAVNYGRPVISVVKSQSDKDSRQVNLLERLNLKNNILCMNSPYPIYSEANYDVVKVHSELNKLRETSINFLNEFLNNEK